MRASCAILAFVLTGTASSAAAQPPRFSARPVPDHVYDGGWEHFVGGGVSAFDCDGDDLPELYAAGGSNPAQLFRNRTSEAGAALAFRAETPDPLRLEAVVGSYPLDIDGDGHLDLAILRVGPDLLMRGLGDCRFQPFTDLGFTSADHWTTAFSATWEAGQDLPTLAFGTYVDRKDPDGPFEACDATRLYRPEGRRYAAALRLEPGYCALSLLFTDWNRAGRPDLRVSNDRHYYVRDGQEQMWAMEAVPRLYMPEEGWQAYSLWGMGIASRDLTGDGYPEVFLTSIGDQKFQMFDPDAGGPAWRDVTYSFGTTAHRPHAGGDGRPSTGWHAAFGDVNNDGLDDIFVSKGNVDQMPDAAMEDPNTLLMQGEDRRFVEIGGAAGIASMARSRGAALVDLNLDGALDLAVVNRRAPMELFQNDGSQGNWLLVRVTGRAPNTQAVGGFVELKTQAGLQVREITVGGGHASGAAGLLHFGLGREAGVELRVIWPDGDRSPWRKVRPNEVVAVVEEE